MEEWRSPNLTFYTTSLNPDLDTHPTHQYDLAQHPTQYTHTTLHSPNGTTVCSIDKRRLDKLGDMYTHEGTNPPFEESLAKLIQRHNIQHILEKIQRELQLSKAKTAPETQPLLCRECPISDKLYDALDACFEI
jgi:hypothetical protein